MKDVMVGPAAACLGMGVRTGQLPESKVVPKISLTPATPTHFTLVSSTPDMPNCSVVVLARTTVMTAQPHTLHTHNSILCPAVPDMPNCSVMVLARMMAM